MSRLLTHGHSSGHLAALQLHLIGATAPVQFRSYLWRQRGGSHQRVTHVVVNDLPSQHVSVCTALRFTPTAGTGRGAHLSVDVVIRAVDSKPRPVWPALYLRQAAMVSLASKAQLPGAWSWYSLTLLRIVLCRFCVRSFRETCFASTKKPPPPGAAVRL